MRRKVLKFLKVMNMKKIIKGNESVRDFSMKQILKMQNFLDQRVINLRIDFFYKVLDTPMSELERRSKAYVTLST